MAPIKGSKEHASPLELRILRKNNMDIIYDIIKFSVEYVTKYIIRVQIEFLKTSQYDVYKTSKCSLSGPRLALSFSSRRSLNVG